MDEYESVREDLREIKNSIKELTASMTQIALIDQRLGCAEVQIRKLSRDSDEAWESLKNIQATCHLRERVYEYGRTMLEAPSISRDNWLSVLIGGAVRNGLWIALTALITLLLGRWV